MVWLKLTTTIEHEKGEYMTSKVILEANYNVDSLLMAYANKRVDWADRKNWLCGDTQPSSRVGWYFGHTLHPLEVGYCSVQSNTSSILRLYHLNCLLITGRVSQAVLELP